MLLNSILIAKQNVLLPYIITPRQVYTELMNNQHYLKQNIGIIK